MTKVRVQEVRDHHDKQEDNIVGCGCCMKRHPRLDKYFERISQDSSAHGVKFIGSTKRHWVERIFWIVVFLACLSFSLILIARILVKFDENPVIISFQSQETQVSQIPFPAITICNVNLLKRSALLKQVSKLGHLLQKNKYNSTHYRITPEILESAAHIDHLSQFCLGTPSFRRRLNETMTDASGQRDFVEELNTLAQGMSDNETAQMHLLERNPKFWKKDHNLFRNTLISCQEMLINCMWAGSMIPCKDIFFHIETESGHCCVFNMMPKFLLQNIPHDDHRAKSEINAIPNDTIDKWLDFAREDLIVKNLSKLEESDYPKHQKAGGKPYGLKVLASPGLHEYSTCTANDAAGFKVVAHSPLSSPSMEYAAAVPIASEAFVEIEPHITVVAERDRSILKSVSIKKRGCYLPSDPKSTLKHYNFYSRESCLTECWAKYTYRNCSCVRFFMPRNANQRVCGAKERSCANQVHANLTKHIGEKHHCSHCITPCTEIKYRLHLSHFELQEHENASSPYTYTDANGETRNGTMYSIIHFYIGTDSFYAKERKMLYDWIDLLANAGGLLGLSLGASLISLVEVVYFFTLRACLHFRSFPKDSHNEKNGSKNKGGTMGIANRGSGSREMMEKKADRFYYSNGLRSRYSSGVRRGGSNMGGNGKGNIVF